MISLSHWGLYEVMSDCRHPRKIDGFPEGSFSTLLWHCPDCRATVWDPRTAKQLAGPHYTEAVYQRLNFGPDLP